MIRIFLLFLIIVLTNSNQISNMKLVSAILRHNLTLVDAARAAHFAHQQHLLRTRHTASVCKIEAVLCC